MRRRVKVIYHYFPSEVSEIRTTALQSRRRSFEQKNSRRPSPRTQAHDAGPHRGLEKQNAVYPVDKDTKSPLQPVLP